jgi:hypothetical protein
MHAISPTGDLVRKSRRADRGVDTQNREKSAGFSTRAMQAFPLMSYPIEWLGFLVLARFML